MHTQRTFKFLYLLLSALFCLFEVHSVQAQSRKISGHVPAAISQLQPARRLAAETNLYLTIGLPLRNQESLSNLLEKLYDPTSPNFRQWLTPSQFTEQFGPSEEDYQKVIRFAERHGLKVAGKHSNRMVLDVTGAVTNIEEAFKVRMHVYRHPKENRMFYAPDVDPTVDADTPILQVGNLNNYEIPHPLLKIKSETNSDSTITPYAKTGSGPGGDFTGKDFRAAYAPGVTGVGTGQYIAIVDVGGAYYTNDITAYELNAGFSTNIVVSNILLSGFTGIPNGPNVDDGEEALDIEMALSMAPGATILNYQGSGDDVFSRIASDNLAKQITLSYGFGIGATIQQAFLQFAAQGQTFFQASGDGGADLPGGTGFTGMPYSTIVGGTALTTTGPAGSYISETTWGGSGGGVSGYGIPYWQQGINMTPIQGSIGNRNYPDVAMLADVVIWWYFKNGTGGTVGGTSASSPEWAGFMALVNEAAAAQSKPPVGFLNPIIYGIGKAGGNTYANTFHDITTGNTFNGHNANKFAATNGYDLCTGWGSPKGISTINQLINYGTNDFTVLASLNGMNIVRGGTAPTVIQVAWMNQYNGPITLSISGLPAGVSAAFSPSATTTNSTILTLTVSNNATLGTTNATITATAGALSHTLALNMTITPRNPDFSQVFLNSYFNLIGMYNDGTTFGGGLDGSGSAFSANLLGLHPSLRNVVFTLGPANGNNVVTCAGQTVALPRSELPSLQVLGCAVNGSQANQSFVVTYSDNTTTTFTQSISDWFAPQNNSSESIIVATPYRNNSNGSKNPSTFNLYQYSFTLDPAKIVTSIKLPNNNNVKVLAMEVGNAPESVSLASFYNRGGMYSDGTNFSAAVPSGLDNGGAAFSATLLGGSQVISNVQFNFGPPNTNNVVTCANQTIPLPQQRCESLRMLATAVQGAQTSQSFLVTYTDGTISTFTQSFSDWFVPQSLPGEFNAVIMGHRNIKDGTADNRAFYLYGYSYTPVKGKNVQSIRLPTNPNLHIAAISVVPDTFPVFLLSPFKAPVAQAGQPYSAPSIATNVYDFDGDSITFSKMDGPAWLTVLNNGTLSGTPLSGDVGLNTVFDVRATDANGLANSSVMTLTVTAAPPITASVTPQGTNLLVSWIGGIGPYQVQTNGDLTPGNWGNFGSPVSSSNIMVAATNSAMFYRVVGN